MKNIDYIKIIKRMFMNGAKVKVHEDGRIEIIPKEIGVKDEQR